MAVTSQSLLSLKFFYIYILLISNIALDIPQLRIDKESRAMSHVSGCSAGTISSTVTIYIPYER